MNQMIESGSFLLPKEVKDHVAGRLTGSGGIRSLELELKGDAMEGAKKFGDNLIALRKKGVKVSHEFLIRLDFPSRITREEALAIVEGMPRPKNGSLKVRVHLVNEERSES